MDTAGGASLGAKTTTDTFFIVYNGIASTIDSDGIPGTVFHADTAGHTDRFFHNSKFFHNIILSIRTVDSIIRSECDNCNIISNIFPV